MKLSLRCPQNIQTVLSEILAARGIAVIDDAAFSLVDRAFSPPANGIAVLFDGAKLDELLQFLERVKTGCGVAKRKRDGGRKKKRRL